MYPMLHPMPTRPQAARHSSKSASAGNAPQRRADSAAQATLLAPTQRQATRLPSATLEQVPDEILKALTELENEEKSKPSLPPTDAAPNDKDPSNTQNLGPMRLQQIAEHLRKSNALLLRKLPNSFRSEEVCRISVKANGLALEHVPRHLRTAEICRIAVLNDRLALQWVPPNLLAANTD